MVTVAVHGASTTSAHGLATPSSKPGLAICPVDGSGDPDNVGDGIAVGAGVGGRGVAVAAGVGGLVGSTGEGAGVAGLALALTRGLAAGLGVARADSTSASSCSWSAAIGSSTTRSRSAAVR